MTANVLDAVRHEAPDAVVVSVGSGEEYGPPETVPTTEDAPAAPAEPVRGLEGVVRRSSPASTPTPTGCA